MIKNSVKLVIGDKNLSSWSMRPWLVLKASGIPFKEAQVLLDRPDTVKKLKRVSPSQRVPVLFHNGLKIWDSLAICEYINELAPDKKLWPQDLKRRAVARSFVAEIHSGFSGLRGQLSMDITLRTKIKHLSPQTVADINRIVQIWSDSLKKSKGPFLFGEFGVVDAFYAPVVFRFQSYGIDIKNPLIRKYRDAILKHPAVQEWVRGAKKERAYFTKF
jgi:glutathione S-transferase